MYIITHYSIPKCRDVLHSFRGPGVEYILPHTLEHINNTDKDIASMQISETKHANTLRYDSIGASCQISAL